MGLDNGIMIEPMDNPKAARSLERFKMRYCDSYEVCYWRKCWNIRNCILEVVGGRFAPEEQWRFPLTVEHIEDIIVILKSLNEENWDSFGHCIWEWSEMRWTIREQIRNLTYLRRMMARYDLNVYFYDSY